MVLSQYIEQLDPVFYTGFIKDMGNVCFYRFLGYGEELRYFLIGFSLNNILDYFELPPAQVELLLYMTVTFNEFSDCNKPEMRP